MELHVSYGRKLNHELYGGNSYESSDFFASVKIAVDDEFEDIHQLYHDLHETVKTAVESAVEREIMYFQGGLPVQDFKAWLYDYVAGRKVQGNLYEQMSPYQKDLVQLIKRGKATLKRDNAKHQPT